MKYVLKKADQTAVEEIFSLYLKRIQWMNEKRNRSVEQQWLSAQFCNRPDWKRGWKRNHKSCRSTGSKWSQRKSAPGLFHRQSIS